MQKIILFDIDGTLINGCLRSYPDTSFLKFIKKDFTLGIFSQGFKSIQLLKLRINGLLNVFDPKLIFISHNKQEIIPQIISQLKEAIFIDNDLSIVFSVIKNGGNAILIDRDDISVNLRTYTIRSLLEINRDHFWHMEHQ